jgi:hypothetical protein
MSRLVQSLVGSLVIVKTADGFKILGKLIGVQEPGRIPFHKPAVLILETQLGKCIVRSWSTVELLDGRLLEGDRLTDA